MRQEHAERLGESIVEFCRFLRGQGFSCTPGQTLTALEATRVGFGNGLCGLAGTLQTALCATQEEWKSFPGFFEAFWEEAEPRARLNSGRHKETAKRGSEPREEGQTAFLEQEGNNNAEPEGETKAVYTASAQERLKKVDFSEAPRHDLEALEELSLRLLRRMSLRLSRRLKAASDSGAFVDLRRTIRRSISRGGEPVTLAYRTRKPQKKRLVILLDISGSMNFYSFFLVRFAYALQSRFKRVNTFLFSTGLVEISDLLRARDLSEALRGLAKRSAGWSGGTRIGESLLQFNRLYARRLLTRDTVFMILSDGWDTGEPQVLATQLGLVKRRARRIIWLNPLLGLKDYQPLTRGMSAALPHVDVFAPAHNLESLLALERYL